MAPAAPAEPTPPLTTTSYAILGLLALRPWATYELAQQMKRALGQFWPRAESNLYAEPKKLVALGLAKASAETVGKRPRTVYAITARGRGALSRWVATEPGAGPVLEFEQLVKVFLAEHGSKLDLLAAINAARSWAEERTEATVHIPHEYLQGRGGFPERLPWIILVGEFLSRYTELVAAWAGWAAGIVETWPDNVTAATPDWPALERMAARGDTLLREAAAHRRQGERGSSD